MEASMMIYSTVLSAAVLIILGPTESICSGEVVPVFIWGDLSQKSQLANPLEHMHSSDLQDKLRAELTSGAVLIAFVEETLSVEDLSRRDESGSYMPYLRRQLKRSTYLPSVRAPVRAITSAADEDSTVRLRLTKTGLSRPLSEVPKETSVIVIELVDAVDVESRSSLLRRHDRFMSETVGRLEDKFGEVVAVYTAHYPSWSLIDNEEPSRYRRQVDSGAAGSTSSEDSVADTQTVYNLTYLILALDNITVSTRGGAPVALTIPAAGPSLYMNLTEQWIDVSVQDDSFNVTLTFIQKSSGYWFLSKAIVRNVSSSESEGFTTSAVYALSNFSYHCSPGVKFSGINGTYALAINNMQAQPFFDGNSQMFGDTFDCVGFFSAPIWAGIFVLTIILSIFFYGITNMMDIRTMDRFDDPKGKTITINASE